MVSTHLERQRLVRQAIAERWSKRRLANALGLSPTQALRLLRASRSTDHDGPRSQRPTDGPPDHDNTMDRGPHDGPPDHDGPRESGPRSKGGPLRERVATPILGGMQAQAITTTSQTGQTRPLTARLSRADHATLARVQVELGLALGRQVTTGEIVGLLFRSVAVHVGDEPAAIARLLAREAGEAQQ